MKHIANKGTTALAELPYDVIQAHILAPDDNPLPEKLESQFRRVVKIAQLLDDYPDESQLVKMMRVQDRTSIGQLRRDIVLAKQLFKSRHEFDWDFWFAWQIRDQLQLIARAKERNDLKAWNAAKKTLHEIIGDKPEAIEDPRRMERNVFNIQINYNGKTASVDLAKLRNLPPEVMEQILMQAFEPAATADAEAIFVS